MTPKTIIYVSLNNSLELDNDQGEGIRDQLQFAIQQHENRKYVHMYRFSEDTYKDKPSDCTLSPEKLKKIP